MRFIPTQTSEDARLADHSVALLPIGAFEQHGSHLPLATDTIIASIIAGAIAEEYGHFLLPPITISCSHEHSAFAGTVSISASTLQTVVSDIQVSLHQSDIDKLVLVNAHGGNYVLGNIVQQANVERARLALFPRGGDWAAARHAAGMETNSHDDMHGGELETSILLAYAPDLVANDFADHDHLVPVRDQLLVHGMREYTTSGVIGMPSRASASKGEAVLTALVTRFKFSDSSISG